MTLKTIHSIKTNKDKEWQALPIKRDCGSGRSNSQRPTLFQKRLYFNFHSGFFPPGTHQTQPHSTWIQPCTSPSKLNNCRATGKWQHRHITLEGRCSFCPSLPCSHSSLILSPNFPLIWRCWSCFYCQNHMLNAVTLRSLKRQSSYLPTGDCSSPR